MRKAFISRDAVDYSAEKNFSPADEVFEANFAAGNERNQKVQISVHI
ncbi:MAG: hypothetical protein ACOCX8_02055 [Bacteroidota bacterium]